MQRYIIKNKNYITLLSGLLIIAAFISKLLFANSYIFNAALIIASIIGLAPIAIQSYQALKVKVISIDTLVTFAVIGAFLIQNYEESAIVTFLFLFGARLEARTLNSTRSAIRELVDMAPEVAYKLDDSGEYVQVDVDEVDKGDQILVKTGNKIPVDGTVLSGEGYINESSITGESIPVTKVEGSSVYVGTILENGTIQIKAERIGEDTTFGRIIELVEEAQDSKSDAERFIDRFSRWYTPLVLILAVLVWLIFRDVELAITVLVLGCPGALVIGIPVSNVSGIGNGARNGVLLKGSEVINDFAKVDTMIFDKTGTLTVGSPEKSDMKVYGDDSDLRLIASVENESDHPLAKAVLSTIPSTNLAKVENTDVVKGKGIIASVNKHRVAIGNLALMEKENIELTEGVLTYVKELEKDGNSLVFAGVDRELKLVMGIRDQIRPDVKKELEKLKKLGVKNLIVLSGDNQGTVDVIAKELGLTEAYGHMLPEDKSKFLEERQRMGEIVAFIGDGVNDSPSIAKADIGIAMGNGTDVAIETSDVVLMNSDFAHLSHALGLTKATANNMIQNITIAIGVVVVLVFSLFFSDWMNMTIGMLVHEGSILAVILNGMRLLRYKLRD